MSDLLGIHEVRREGQSVGSLKIEQNGLMTHFDCECDYRSDSVLRLAGVSGGEYARLGVLVPESGKLTFKKSYTKNALLALGLEVKAGFFAVLSGEQYEAAKKPSDDTAAADIGKSAENKSGETAVKAAETKELETAPPPDMVQKGSADKPEETRTVKKLPVEKLPRTETAGLSEPVLRTKTADMVIKHKDNDKKMSLPPEAGKPPPVPDRESVSIPEPVPRREWTPIPDPSVLFDDIDIANACKDAKGALTMEENGITLLAIPVIPGEPFPMMPVFCFGDSMMLDGREYIIFKSKNGKFVV